MAHFTLEYQVTMTTGKMQKLSQQIKNDRGVNERMKKSHANEITLQSTETKKLALEVSRLKVYQLHIIALSYLHDKCWLLSTALTITLVASYFY